MEKKRIGYRVYRTHPSNEYSNLTIEILTGIELDAAKEYDDRPDADRLDKLQKIRSQGESTKYIYRDSCRDNAFDIKWQADRDRSCQPTDGTETIVDWQWYAPRIEGMYFDPRAAKLASKLVTLVGYDPQPSKVLDALEAMGARQVYHGSDTPFSCFVYRDQYDRSELAVNPWAKATMVGGAA